MTVLDDTDRLLDLYRVLGTAPDDAVLAACTRAAAELAGAPIALVSLVASRTQIFVAQRGLPTELAIACGTSRTNSFCQFVVRDDAPFVVTDAATDPRVPRELVERYSIRAYLGFPVRVAGVTLGSLCVLDTVPRVFSAATASGVEHLAAEVSSRLLLLSRRSARPPSGARLRSPDEVGAQMQAIIESIPSALAVVEPQIAAARALDPAAITPEALASSRPMLADALRFFDEAVAAVDALDRLDLERGQGWDAVSRGLLVLRGQLFEAKVLARVAAGFLRGGLAPRDTARALSVTRDALALGDAVADGCRAMQAAPEAMPAANGREP